MMSRPVRCRRFIGRRTQLDLLARSYAMAAAGSGLMVLIAGEAGIGKSRLVTEFCSGISRSATHCATGHCLEYAKSPFAPILDVLRAFLGDEPDVLRLRDDIREPLAYLLPELGEGAEGAVESDKLRQFNAMAEALRQTAISKPAIVVLEDLHWADAATLEFLQHLLLSLGASRILLLGTYRPEELHSGHALMSALARLERHRAVLGVELEPLSSAEMNSFISHVLEDRAPLDSEVIAAIQSRAEGNPLFAEELLKNASAKAGSSALSPLPRTLREAVLERLEVLDPDERRLLVEAAVVGQRFQAEFLAVVTGTPLEQTLAVLRRARDLQMIVEESNGGVYYAFRHALTREAVYGELLTAQARSLHRRVAAALEGSAAADEALAELAYHWWQAREPDKSAHYNELAGDRAFRVYAYRDSLVNYERALEFDALDGAHRASLQRKLAKALQQCGLGVRARSALEAALEYYLSVGDLENAAWTCLSLGRLRGSLADISGQVEMTERALALAGSNAPSPVLFGAHVAMANLHTSYRCDTVKALEHLARAEEQCANPAPRVAMRFLEARSMLQILLGQPREAFDQVERATQVAAATSDVQSLIRCWGNLGVTMAQSGEHELALEAFNRALDIVRDRRFGALTGSWVTMEFAYASLLHGELEKGRELVELALTANIEMLRFRMLLARTGILLGLMLENGELLQRCAPRDLIGLAISSGALNMVEALAAIVEYYHAQGKAEEAGQLLHRAVEAFDAHQIQPPPGNADWLLTVAKHGNPADIPRAREFMERAVQSSKVRSMPPCLALFEAYAANRAQRCDQAAAKGSQAALLFHEIRWPYHEAQALELAGQPKDALEIYRRIGDIRDAGRVETALNPPNRRGRSKTDLTEREREIAALVAAGKSNRAIADQLVISERTVESHVSSIFNKLNVKTRFELAVHIARDPPPARGELGGKPP